MDDENFFIKQYTETEEPYRLPDNMDLITWSIPFLSDKVVEMLEHLMDYTSWTREVEMEDNLEDMDLPPLLTKESSYVDYAKVMKKLHKDVDKQQDARIKKFNRVKTKVLMIARFNWMRIQAQKER